MEHPIIVSGNVYSIGGAARLKINISFNGAPLTGQSPTVTIVRDSDNFAVDFVLNSFEATTPVTLNTANFKNSMVELGEGNYYFDFEPSVYGETTEQLYTVIYRNETPPYFVTEQDEFLFSDRFEKARLGLVMRPLEVCINEQVLIWYQATTGQTDVTISIYNKFDQLLISDATMQELGSTGLFKFPFIFTLDGEFLIIAKEDTQGSKDSMIIRAGGMCDRLKRVERLLSDFIQNPPTVTPC